MTAALRVNLSNAVTRLEQDESAIQALHAVNRRAPHHQSGSSGGHQNQSSSDERQKIRSNQAGGPASRVDDLSSNQRPGVDSAMREQAHTGGGRAPAEPGEGLEGEGVKLCMAWTIVWTVMVACITVC